MNKRGQFYLIAAIIIIGVVFGFFSTRSYVKTEKEAKIYDLSDELKEEGARVINYGITHSTKLDEFMESVSQNYLGERVQDITFIYGNKEGIIKKKVWEETEVGTVGSSGMGVIVKKKILNEQESEDYPSGTTEVSVLINEQPYDFELEEGENFFIILEKDVENEKYIEIR